MFDVAAEIDATNLASVEAALEFDGRFIRLVQGEATVQLPTGNFHRELSWKFEAVEEVEEACIRISIGGELPQLAEIRLRITRLKRI
jgi:hypothetical protein